MTSGLLYAGELGLGVWRFFALPLLALSFRLRFASAWLEVNPA